MGTLKEIDPQKEWILWACVGKSISSNIDPQTSHKFRCSPIDTDKGIGNSDTSQKRSTQYYIKEA
jgi:hypothetical protein